MSLENRGYRLIFIRHGESALNQLKRSWSAYFTPHWLIWAVFIDRLFPGRFYPEIDARKSPLTKTGRIQAKQTGIWLKGELNTAKTLFFHSPLTRACETALELSISDKWEVNADLVERSWGVNDKFLLFSKLRLAKTNRDLENGRLPQGSETISQVNERWLNFLGHLYSASSRNQGIRDFVIVSHGEFIAAVCLFLLGHSAQQVERKLILPNGGALIVSADRLSELIPGMRQGKLTFSVFTDDLSGCEFEMRFSKWARSLGATYESLS